MSEVEVTRWAGEQAPTQGALRQRLADEGLQGYTWSNAAGDVYAAHRHGYHKVIYVLQGSIVFGLPEREIEVALETGDRLDLPAGVLHEAVVGTEGVVCLEAHRS